ncbi:MAG: GGDEF domain-containing protein [Deltaproteobacteria bacterium]|nr:GGDEF domain-containing protein [Deltaproteobacteria bacterium]
MSRDEEERTGCFSLEELLQQSKRDQRKLVATLTCLSGRSMGKVYKLAGSMIIGRSELANVQVEDDGISRKHAEIVELDGTYILRDLGSTNGTVCNGVRLTDPITLRDGDRIRLGPNSALRFDYADEVEEQMQSKLYDMATRDPLTGAYNRRFFHDRLGSEWAWAIRHRRPCTLVAMDIDHFKRVNDTYGHQAGDEVLKGVVAVVYRTIRKEDLFARVGGEEFILLARATSLGEGVVLAERVRTAMEHNVFKFGPSIIPVTISLGVATSSDPSIETPDHLMMRADEWLYAAKQNGRNRVEHEQK